MSVKVSLENPYAGATRVDGKSLRDTYAGRLLEWHGLLPADRRDAANLTAAFARQLEYVYAEVINVVYSKLKARKLIPIDTQVPSAAETFTYRQWSQVAGKAAIVASDGYSDDAPQPKLYMAEFPQRIVSLTSS